MPDKVQNAYTWSNLVLIHAQSYPLLSNPARLLCPWDSPGMSTGVGCHSLLRGDLPDPVVEPGSPELHTEVLYHLSHQGSFMDRGAWQAAVHGAATGSDTTEWLSKGHVWGQHPYSSPCCQGFCLAKWNFRLSIACLFTSSPPYLGLVSLPLCFPQHSGWIVFMSL